MMRLTAMGATAGCVVLVAQTPVAAGVLPQAAPQVQCQPEPGAPKSQITGEPWAQQILSIKGAQQTTKGNGVKVAVIDSGVDPRHPQLAGQVARSVDLTRTNTQDCVGHGTAVAGIIAGKPGLSPFYGVAPGAKIIAIKFAASDSHNDDRLMIQGIRKAVALGADVINVSAQTATDQPALRAAVQEALRRNIVVVAAAGNLDPEGGGLPTPAYPAQYPGVISVGAVDQSGQVTQFTNPRTQVSVIAPGKEVITTAPKGGYYSKEGTSFAAPFVAGVAALVRESHPGLTSAQVKQRIEATADGSRGIGSGHGMVNPHEAVTAVLSANGGGDGPVAQVKPVKISMPHHADPFTRNVAFGVSGGALGVAALVVAGGFVIPLGRRRGWKPGRVTPRSE
ncbi:MAG TPA: S8 family serine peptidase [Actinomadura sp.]|jgi:type VII secretion-associated serine protease mycosin|nr:S8 family serine peptidase [Actinomadura sp.]